MDTTEVHKIGDQQYETIPIYVTAQNENHADILDFFELVGQVGVQLIDGEGPNIRLDYRDGQWFKAVNKTKPDAILGIAPISITGGESEGIEITEQAIQHIIIGIQ